MIARIRKFITWLRSPEGKQRISDWLDHVIYILSNRAGDDWRPRNK